MNLHEQKLEHIALQVRNFPNDHLIEYVKLNMKYVVDVQLIEVFEGFGSVANNFELKLDNTETILSGWTIVGASFSRLCSIGHSEAGRMLTAQNSV
jgi:hypothetical protein